MPTAMVADGAATVHASVNDTQSDVLTGFAAELISQVWKPAFPSAELVDQAAALLPRITRARRALADLEEGPRPYIRIGPGVIEVRTKDYARADRADERERHRREVDVDLLAEYLDEHGYWPNEPDPTRVITEWSRKSQSNMLRSIGMLDFSLMYSDRTRVPAMLTLTYPGAWLEVAPSGRAVKRHLKALRKRYERAWGETWRTVWKLEFQRRGAPHVHMLIVPPHGQVDGRPFREWVSRAWADVVDHPDPEQYQRHLGAGTAVDYPEGMRASDPKRVGVYFLKHGSFKDKAYQNIVPEEWSEPGKTPGRFWGYWGLSKKTAVVEVEQKVGDLAGRTLRRWSAAQGTTREVSKPRTPGGVITSVYQEVIGLAGKLLLATQKPTRYRKSRTRAGRMAKNRGFVMVNSGPEMASQLARYLDQACPQGQ